MKKIILIIFLLPFAQEVLGQSFYSRRVDRKWVATGGLGYARSLSDLTNPGSYFDTKLNLTGGLQFRATDRLNIRAGLLLFQLAGEDAEIDPELNTRTRGLSFVSNNAELSATASFSLFPHNPRFRQRKFANPYVFAGIGGLFFDPRAELPDSVNIPGRGWEPLENAGRRVSLAKYDTERPNDYSRFAVVIPIGAGVKFKVNDYLDVSIEASNRITFTDYLDDVSGPDYPEAELFDFSDQFDREAYALSDPTGLGEIRGNPEDDDFYLIVNVKAEFYLQGTFLDKLFGIGGKRFNPSPRRGRGFFNSIFGGGARRR